MTAPGVPASPPVLGPRAVDPARWLGSIWHHRTARIYLGLGVLAVATGAPSLLLPSTPSYDPWAWLIWGREIAHFGLHTAGGPSWKPLPVLFTTLFAPFGRLQPDLWLVVARAGAVMAVAMAFRLAYRLTGTLTDPAGRLRALAPVLAGCIAAGSLLNVAGFATDSALGYSEGLVVALTLIAVERVFDGAPRTAFVLGFLAALDRPELWVLWVPFGLYLWRRDPTARRLVLALFVLTPVLWFLPELWGSGDPFRAIARAQHPLPGGAAGTSCPLCTVLGHQAWPSLLGRVKLPALAALVAGAWGVWSARGSRGRGSRTRALLVALTVGGLLWWLGIAIETQLGFAGNPRYLLLGTAALGITGGVAWGWLAGSIAGLAERSTWSRARRGPPASAQLPLLLGVLCAVGLFLAVPPWIAQNVISLPQTRQVLSYQADLRQDLAAALHRAGGANALLRCGTVMTEGYQVPMAAWMLGVPSGRVEGPRPGIVGPPWPNVILQTRAHPSSALLPSPSQIVGWERAGAHYDLVARAGAFSVYSTCAHKVPS